MFTTVVAGLRVTLVTGDSVVAVTVTVVVESARAMVVDTRVVATVSTGDTPTDGATLRLAPTVNTAPTTNTTAAADPTTTFLLPNSRPRGAADGCTTAPRAADARTRSRMVDGASKNGAASTAPPGASSTARFFSHSAHSSTCRAMRLRHKGENFPSQSVSTSASSAQSRLP